MTAHETEREAIRRLATNIPVLWAAPTTTGADRKEIIPQIVERVVVDVQGNSERVKVRKEEITHVLLRVPRPHPAPD